jgi:predicted dehydrogenase
MEKLKVGIIGCGVIFDLNILGYLNNPDVQVTCLCDKRKKRAQQKIKKFNLNSEIKIYTDYMDLLDSESLDIIEILLPHHLHCETTLYAAQTQLKGISVQKPMATTISECDKMIKSCEKNNIKLKIFENFTFYPPIMHAKQLLKKGILGELNSVHIKTFEAPKGGWSVPKSTWRWRIDPDSCGGGLDCGSPYVFDDGYHKFWLALHLIEAKIEKVYAWIDRYANLDIPAYIMWKYRPPEETEFLVPSYGIMEYNYSPQMIIPSPYYNEDEIITIVGSKGTMWINQATSGGNVMSDSEVFPPIVLFKEGKISTIQNLKRDWKYGFINSTKHFIKIIKEGGAPVLSGEEGKYTTQFALAALKSSMCGKEICPDDIE